MVIVHGSFPLHLTTRWPYLELKRLAFNQLLCQVSHEEAFETGIRGGAPQFD
jgi:hypothetical protein